MEFTIWVVVGFVFTGVACVILGIFIDRAWRCEDEQKRARYQKEYRGLDDASHSE